MRDVHDVGVELLDGLRDVGQRPGAPGLHVVQEVVQDRVEVRLQQVEEGLQRK